MRRTLFVVLLGLLTLTSCQTEVNPPPLTELPFATHLSVLRGNWTGTILNVPISQDVPFRLIDIIPECSGQDGDRCYLYTFEGQISMDDSAPVRIAGQGSAGPNHIYTLTSPPQPLGINASFEFGGETWELYADYLPNNALIDDVAPSFEGDIYTSERNSRIRLESTP